MHGVSCLGRGLKLGDVRGCLRNARKLVTLVDDGQKVAVRQGDPPESTAGSTIGSRRSHFLRPLDAQRSEMFLEAA
jgi:hypothetical protein